MGLPTDYIGIDPIAAWLAIGAVAGDEPDIVSHGADGQPGGDGINADIVSWKPIKTGSGGWGTGMGEERSYAPILCKKPAPKARASPYPPTPIPHPLLRLPVSPSSRC